MKYPCNICIVQSCCSIQCLEYFTFINYISDNICSTMTADEIHEYRMNTPIEIRKRVDFCIQLNTRYAKAARWVNYPTNVRMVKAGSEDAITG